MTSQTSPSSTFSAEVRAQLARQRRTADELAVVLGVHEVTVRRRLNDQGEWPLDDVMQTCQFLGTDLQEMLPFRQAAS